MLKYFEIENNKNKKNGLFFIGLFFVVFSLFIGTSLFMLNRDVFQNDGTEVIALWGQSAFYYSQLFYPICIALMVSIACNIESKNKNWQRMRTVPVSNINLVLSKLFILSFYLLLIQLAFYVLYIAIAIFIKLPIHLSILIKLLRWTLISWLGGTTILSMQLFLSIKTNSFTAPVGIAAAGSFIGFGMLFVNEKLLSLFPYSQGTIGMRARSLVDFRVEELVTFIIFNIVFILIMNMLSIRSVNKKF